MTSQNYLMIQENVVTNVVYWDGNVNTWQPPADAIMLVEATTIAMLWEIPEGGSSYVLTPNVGQGGIGFTWDGSVLTTNAPKPTDPVIPPVQTI